ncbi:MAG: DUF2249 domain-containing protein [Halobacteriales archaeon]
MSDRTDPDRTLDVREIDGQPFEAIMEALEELDPDEQLALINSFEPEPLYGILDQRGFNYETIEHAPEKWCVTIEHA